MEALKLTPLPERIHDEFVVYQIVGKPKAIAIKHDKENHS